MSEMLCKKSTCSHVHTFVNFYREVPDNFVCLRVVPAVKKIKSHWSRKWLFRLDQLGVMINIFTF